METMKAKRPRSVTWLAVGVLMLTGLQFVRLVNTLLIWDYLHTLPLSVPPIFFAVSGLIWGLVGLGMWWGLWRGKNWAISYSRYAVIIFAIYYWIDQLFLMVNPLRKTNFPFVIGMTLILLAITIWVLSRPKTQLFFGETYE